MPLRYFLVASLVIVLIGVNFYVIPIETFLDKNLPGGIIRSIGYLVLYTLIYYSATSITLSTKKRLSIFSNRLFWQLSMLGLILFSFDRGYWLPQLFLDKINSSNDSYSFYHSLISNGKGIITISALLLLVNYLIIRNKDENLGLNKLEIDIKPFFTLLVVVAPFIFISVMESGLSDYYPTFKYSNIADIWNSPRLLPVIVYESIYGLDFLNVELFFRGFLIIGLSTILGKDAILPMAAFYCSIHFGKPMVECISSFFGGYILGVIAFETRSIWGGVIMHVGIAWLMEIAAFITK